MRLLHASRHVECLICLLCLCIAASQCLPAPSPVVDDGAKQDWQPQRNILARSPETIAANTTITWAIVCVYPVSGIYTRMQRMLFYGAMVFVFLLRTQGWLVAVGLTFILTYSTAACIHAILLSTLSGIGPDLDIVVLQGFVGVVTFAGFCYSFYSLRISKHTIAPLFYIWTVFALATFIIVLCLQSGITAGNIKNLIVAADCNADGRCDPNVCGNPESNGLFRSSNDQVVPAVLEPWVSYNGSTATSIWDFANATIHSNGQVPDSATLVSKSQPYARAIALNKSYSSALSWFLQLSCPILMPTLSSLVHTMPCSRNLFFVWMLKMQILVLQLLRGSDRRSLMRYVWNRPQRKKRRVETEEPDPRWSCSGYPKSSSLSKHQLNFARLLASCWFIWAISGRFILPLLPFVFLAVVEWSLTGLPETEAPWQVGQWAPFVSVGLALLAAIIMRLVTFLRNNRQADRCRIMLSDSPLDQPMDVDQAKSSRPRVTDRLQVLTPAWKEFAEWWKDPLSISRQDWEKTERRIAVKRARAKQQKESRRDQQQKRDMNAKEASMTQDEKLEFGHIFREEIPRDVDFQNIWKRLEFTKVQSVSPKDWSVRNPYTSEICRVGSHESSASPTGCVVNPYEDEEFEHLTDAEFERRKQLFDERMKARERDVT